MIPNSNNQFNYSNERFADLQMLRYRIDGLEALDVQRKAYVFYLAKATLAGRDITTDQYGKYNLTIRKTLEALWQGCKNKSSDDFLQMEVYLKRVWFSNGIYHHYGCEKFEPGFSEPWFREAVKDLDPVTLPLGGYRNVDALLNAVCPVIFDPAVLPKRVNQAEGEDLVQTSACNFYEGLTQKEAEDFYASMRDPEAGDCQPSWGLNSKLVKRGGKAEEEKYTTNGLYGPALQKIVYWLNKAKGVAENDLQKKLIDLLIQYYTTGDLHVFDEYSIEWLKEQQGAVDFINGFIEVYGDPLGMKGTWEGIAPGPSPGTPSGLKTIRRWIRGSASRKSKASLRMSCRRRCSVGRSILPRLSASTCPMPTGSGHAMALRA